MQTAFMNNTTTWRNFSIGCLYIFINLILEIYSITKLHNNTKDIKIVEDNQIHT